MEQILPLLVWLPVIAVGVALRLAKRSRNRSAAKSGDDKQRLHAALSPLPEAVQNGRIVYAHREEHSSYGRAVRVTYYRYAVAFQGQTMYIYPLSIDKKTRLIQPARPTVITPAGLGKVTLKTKEKDGALAHLELSLLDKQGHTILDLTVDRENLRKSRWFPVNILQPEECAAFQLFAQALSRQAAAENPGIDEIIRAEGNEGVGIMGAIASVIGAVFSIFFPPLGAVLCGIGLLTVLASKLKGAKGKVPLIISILCAAESVFFIWMFCTYYI